MYLPEYIGLEIEFELTSPSKISEKLLRFSSNYFILVNDASVEKRSMTFKGIPIESKSVTLKEIYNVSKNICGGELIFSSPFPLSIFKNEEFRYQLNSILEELHCEENNIRSSVHVHIDINNSIPSKSLRIYKNIIRLLNRSESLIYKMSGIFKPHRGIYNNYNYCRPITLWGPACFRVFDGFNSFYYGQLFNTQKLLASKTVEEFFSLYGDSYRNRNWKRHPVRYHGFNLFSLLRHGSLEYRTMNFTNSFTNIYAMTLFFYYLTSAMINMNYKDILKLNLSPMNSIYSPNEKDSYFFLQFVLDLIPDEYKIYKNRLIDLYQKGISCEIQEGYYMSHMIEKCSDVLFGERFHYEKPKLIESNLIMKPTYVDIHNIENNNVLNRLIDINEQNEENEEEE